MKNKLRVLLLFVCMAVALQASSSQETAKKEKNGKAEARLSFIRMDLLRVEKKPLPPAPRSIFTAGRSRYTSIDQERLKEETEKLEETGGVQGEQSEEYIDLRYVGYVRSGNRIVALIIFQGEAMAVAEGELIAEGITVNKIGLEEIEVVGPDSKPSMFLLEGELP